MSLITLNGSALSSGKLDLPLVGAWHLEAELVATTAPVEGEGVTLSLGGAQFVGTVMSAASDAGNRVTVRAVGGAGGLGDTASAKGYVQTVARSVVIDALKVGGEKLSVTSDPLAQSLDHWTRIESSVADVVRQVAEHLGVSWRVLPDGTVWLGTETWLPVTVAHVLESEEPTRKAITVALEAASVVPGSLFLGHQVSAVRYTFDARRLRARVSYGDTRGEAVAALGELVRRETRKSAYHGIYLATADAQNADLTLELTPADSTIPGLSRVPIKPGVPGCTVPKLTPGAKVIFSHENGDPTRPRVVGFDTSTALEIALNATARVQVGESASEVLLGTGSQFVALANLVADQFSQLAAAYNGHKHPISGGSTLIPDTIYTPGNVAAVQVKAT